MSIKIIASAKVLPLKKVDNHFFSSYLETDDEWIQKRTGIKTRHFFEEGEWDNAILEAAQKTVAGTEKEKIKLIVVASMSTMDKMPIRSAMIHHALALDENVMVFDLNVACTGFITALSVAERFLELGERALVVGAEKLSNLINFNDRGTAILFGDGVGALLLEKNDKDFFKVFGARYDDEVLFAKAKLANYIKMEGQAVFRFATEQVTKTVETLVKQSPYQKDEIDHFIFHQANQRILEYVAKKLDLDKNKIHQNLATIGNTSSASIPILLDDLIQAKLIKNGQKVILVGFGGGLTWGGILFEW